MGQASKELTERAFRDLSDSREEMLEFVSTLVQTRTVTGDEGNITSILSDWFKENGFEAEVKAVDPEIQERFPSLAAEKDLERRPNVFGKLNADNSASHGPLVLNGHIDTVNPGSESLWSGEPFDGRRSDGKVWGRGAADMKGPIVAGAFAMRSVLRAGANLDFDVQLQCVMAEESSGLGTISALETEPRPSAAIVMEPSDCVVCPACGGSLQFEIEVTGEAAHAAVPWTGVSALDNALLLYSAFRKLADQRNKSLSHDLFDDLPQVTPYAVGEFNAGEWRATVPDRAVFAGRMGLLPGESLDDVRAALGNAVDEAAKADDWLTEHPPELRWVNEGYPAWETSLEHPLTRAMNEGYAAVHGRARPGAVTYGSDAGHFANAGIPVAIFGPGRITDAHRENEYIEEDQVDRASRVLASTILNYHPGETDA